MKTGFLKIHRKIMQWEWYSDTNTFRVFFHLLLTANFEDKRWQGIEIKRGQLISSVESLAKSTSLTIKQVRLVLEKLKKTNEITIKTTNRFSIFTLTNYALYQDIEKKKGKQKDKQKDNQKTNEGQTEGKQRATTKEDKNIRNKEDKNIISSLRSEINITDELWKDFLDHRKKIKAPMTEKAEELMLKKLKSWEEQSLNPQKIIEEMIERGWRAWKPEWSAKVNFKSRAQTEYDERNEVSRKFMEITNKMKEQNA